MFCARHLWRQVAEHRSWHRHGLTSNAAAGTGPPGVGKSHIAIAMGREAYRRGYKVRFFSAASLVNLYVEARNEKQVLRLEKSLRQCDLVIVDELGYIPLDRTGAEYLVGFFSLCYERTIAMVTTNLPFPDWPQIFANDERLAGALLDRLTHHVHIIRSLQTASDSNRAWIEML